MITLCSDYYVGEKAGRIRKKIVHELKRGKYRSSVYLLTSALCDYDQMDILPAASLSSLPYQERRVKVAGIASGREEALELVTRMAVDVYVHHAAPDIRSWIAAH